MANYAWPSTLPPMGFNPQLVQRGMRVSSNFGYVGQNIDLVQERWKATLHMSLRDNASGAELEAFMAKLRGGANTCSFGHFFRQLPNGTLRSTTGLAANAAYGADSVSINTTAGATLLAGDMLGVGGQLLQVADTCTANGAGLLVVPVINRLRRAMTAGVDAVVWSYPTAKWRLVSSPAASYGKGGVMLAASYDFVEDTQT